MGVPAGDLVWLAAAVIAVGIAWMLRGPGGDPGGVAAARGTLDPPSSDHPAAAGR